MSFSQQSTRKDSFGVILIGIIVLLIVVFGAYHAGESSNRRTRKQNQRSGATSQGKSFRPQGTSLTDSGKVGSSERTATLPDGSTLQVKMDNDLYCDFEKLEFSGALDIGDGHYMVRVTLPLLNRSSRSKDEIRTFLYSYATDGEECSAGIVGARNVEPNRWTMGEGFVFVKGGIKATRYRMVVDSTSIPDKVDSSDPGEQLSTARRDITFLRAFLNQSVYGPMITSVNLGEQDWDFALVTIKDDWNQLPVTQQQLIVKAWWKIWATAREGYADWVALEIQDVRGNEIITCGGNVEGQGQVLG